MPPCYAAGGYVQAFTYDAIITARCCRSSFFAMMILRHATLDDAATAAIFRCRRYRFSIRFHCRRFRCYDIDAASRHYDAIIAIFAALIR